jgi:hypothetical protein
MIRELREAARLAISGSDLALENSAEQLITLVLLDEMQIALTIRRFEQYIVTKALLVYAVSLRFR